jgi:DNA-binding NarL/FixJ family response regulator
MCNVCRARTSKSVVSHLRSSRGKFQDSAAKPNRQKEATLSKLSPRQKEIAGLIAEGLEPAMIATKLGIKTGSVSNQISRILKKKQCKTSLELCAKIWRERQQRKVVSPLTIQQQTS